MEPVATALSFYFGVLEPIQSAKSIHGQIDELKDCLESAIERPIVLAGHSWGAWLCYLFTIKYPEFVGKLILVSSAPFETSYIEQISLNRIKKLNEQERTEYFDILNRLHGSDSEKMCADLSRLGNLVKKADIIEPIDKLPFSTPANELTKNSGEIHERVWSEAAKLRASGELLELAKDIKCPVTIVHGENDSHPFEGVKKPSQKSIDKMQCYTLKQCGHYPWLEKHACEKFYSILRAETTAC